MINSIHRESRDEPLHAAAPPDLVALQVFCRVVESGSFSEAAATCYLSQSAVSQRVRALERHYGRVLLERGRGRAGAEPTEAGQALYEGARQILEQVLAMETRLREMDGEVGGTIRLATVYSVGLHSLPPSLSRFIALHPQVNVRLEYARTNRILEMLRARRIDLGIVAYPEADRDVEVIPFAREPMVCIAPPEHSFAALDAVPWELLRGEACVAFDRDIPTRRATDELLAAHGAPVRVVSEFDNIETIKRVVENSGGIAFVPEVTVRREVRDGTLIARPMTGGPIDRPTGLILRRGSVRSRAVERFIQVLSACQDHPDSVTSTQEHGESQ
jgi:LysR family transcriptional regulator, transcriptional activator of the cysJI operon